MLDKKCESDFIQFIKDRLGIVIKHHQFYDLTKTVSNACQNLNCTPEEYLSMLLHCSDDSPALEFLVTGITIGETYFFRDSHQMNLLREIILPSLIQAKRSSNNLSLRIWSAGCATGEEIYTIAMLLREMLPDYDKWTIRLMGTDINTISLRKAMEGVYGEWSMRSIPDHFKHCYFTLEANKYHLQKMIKDAVNFSWLNLSNDTYPSMLNNTNAQDLILCRNVLIYFDEQHVKTLMKHLDACLTEGAFLMLGASDPIYTKETGLSPFKHEGALLVHSSVINQEVKVPVAEKKIHPALPEIKQIKIRLPSTPVMRKKMVMLTESDISRLMDEARWEEVIEKISSPQYDYTNQIFMLNALATAYANTGKLESAVKTCQKSIALNATHAYTWFTMAMIQMEMNYLSEAEAALRKALFLDHQFVAGHLQLGLLLIRNGQIKKGLSCLVNALDITELHAATQSVEGFKGMNYGRLADILKHEIELYSQAEKA